MIYNDKNKSTIIKAFNAVNFSFYTYLTKDKSLSFNSVIDPLKWEQSWLELKGDLKNRSFKIEGFPAASKAECGKTGLEAEYSVKCKGKIKIEKI